VDHQSAAQTFHTVLDVGDAVAFAKFRLLRVEAHTVVGYRQGKTLA